MAVDVAASHTSEEVAGPAGQLARAAAIPVWVWLAGIAAASLAGRIVAAASRPVSYYFPDEYIYPALARSLAEHGRPMIRTAGVHFPALLDPIVTAPIWLVTDDSVTAYHLTQGMHAMFVSLAVIPAYLICRRLELARWLCVGVAALAVAVPDAVYASSMLADPLAYPLVLTAIYAGICVVAEPSRRMQLLFVIASGLTIAARIQYVVVPLAVLGAELAADRGRVLESIRRLKLSLFLLIAPPAALFATFGTDRVLGVYSKGDHTLHAAGVAHWVGREALLLVYSSGWAIVPGALVGLAVVLRRPRGRAELAFAVTTLLLSAALLLEAAQIADTDSTRFQERYLFTLVPLLAAAFGLYVQRGLPGRLPVALVSAGLLALSARIPLSGYAAAHNKDDSPTLWAVLRLESYVSTGNGSLAVALAAAALSAVAALVAVRRIGPAFALTGAIAACCALSVGAASFDSEMSRGLRRTLPVDLRWVDHSGVGAADLIAPAWSRREQSWHQLFWNTSLKRLLLLGGTPIDQFDAKAIQVANDGRMRVGGVLLRRPFVVQSFGSTVQLSGVKRVRHELIFDLYKPAGTPRVRLIAAGRYPDRWLAPKGAVTVWTQRGGTLRFELELPRDAPHTIVLRLSAPGIARVLRLRPGAHVYQSFRVPAGGEWSVRFRTPRADLLSDERPVSARMTTLRFSPR